MVRPRPGATTPPAADAPVLPAGASPGREQVREVSRLLEAAAYFPIFNVHDPAVPSETVPLLPIATRMLGQALFTAVDVHEQLQRFEVTAEMGLQGLQAFNAIGADPVAHLATRFTPIPDDYAPSPGASPPPTLLNPFASQRFTMLNGQLGFRDRRVSGVRIFGSGRTYPAGGGALDLGAVIDVLQGTGALYGLNDSLPGATMVINGHLRPPNDLSFNLVLRVMDPQGQLASAAPVPPLAKVRPMPAGTGTCLFFLGEADPRRPIRLLYGSGSAPIGAQVVENLRLVRIGFDHETLESSTQPGPVVGTASSLLYCSFQNGYTVTTAQTTGGVFTLRDLQGRSLGSLFVNMVEGRAFRTYLPGAPNPVFRMGGFGPFVNGTGSFAGARGMMTVNGVFSAFPPTLSNLYVLRFVDSGGRLQERLQATGLAG